MILGKGGFHRLLPDIAGSSGAVLARHTENDVETDHYYAKVSKAIAGALYLQVVLIIGIAALSIGISSHCRGFVLASIISSWCF
ncbi:hypothetical protein NRY68_16405 [Acidithiobacillus ferrooxidans]|uniref:hypothetical protein n=1 Tax=Acidithiobacillus ferrooxidans TaxID=920 RepID=UPI00214745A7|nr:hypothetical protein [Acidithiobacillus ferrooxidans]MCR1347333.1 hypothetical protein [Acidithiobacillus ferrooxidans]MCR1354806.1 hypothetical protein [Acidithiobacillus ferrooxidans]